MLFRLAGFFFLAGALSSSISVRAAFALGAARFFF